MTTKEKLKKQIQDDINRLQEKLNFIESISGLDKITYEASLCGSFVDFDNLPHEDVIEVIKAVGGKWSKTPSDGGKVDYENQIGNHKIRCYRGAPPPNCKIVEELVTIPAVPERTETRRRLVCQ